MINAGEMVTLALNDAFIRAFRELETRLLASPGKGV